MRRVFYSVFISFLFFACSSEEENTSINVTNPLENLKWLKEKKENFEGLMNSVKVDIIQFRYDNHDVFLINDCVNCADALTKVYNCDGEVICEFGGITGLNTCPDFKDNAQLVGVLWRNYERLIINKEKYDTTNTDNYTITSASIQNNILTLEITSSGCSGDSWIVNLVDSEEIVETMPVQRNLKIELINNEVCLAIVTKEVQIDISKLQISNANQILLQLENWNQEINYKY